MLSAAALHAYLGFGVDITLGVRVDDALVSDGTRVVDDLFGLATEHIELCGLDSAFGRSHVGVVIVSGGFVGDEGDRALRKGLEDGRNGDQM